MWGIKLGGHMDQLRAYPQLEGKDQDLEKQLNKI